MFGWHKEDMDLYSINYNHYGKPKFWYCLPLSEGKKLEDFMKMYFGEGFNKCKEFPRHKTIMIHPYLLKQKIPDLKIFKMIQYPGEFIITGGGAYHAGFNWGFNIAEAVNFATIRWLDMLPHAGVCHCVSDSVRINKTDFFKNILANPKYANSPEVKRICAEHGGIKPDDPSDKTEDKKKTSKKDSKSKNSEEKSKDRRRSSSTRLDGEKVKETTKAKSSTKTTKNERTHKEKVSPTKEGTGSIDGEEEDVEETRLRVSAKSKKIKRADANEVSERRRSKRLMNRQSDNKTDKAMQVEEAVETKETTPIEKEDLEKEIAAQDQFEENKEELELEMEKEKENYLEEANGDNDSGLINTDTTPVDNFQQDARLTDEDGEGKLPIVASFLASEGMNIE
jgi:hypothetical protein